MTYEEFEALLQAEGWPTDLIADAWKARPTDDLDAARLCWVAKQQRFELAALLALESKPKHVCQFPDDEGRS